jgi:hypothetical protein
MNMPNELSTYINDFIQPINMGTVITRLLHNVYIQYTEKVIINFIKNHLHHEIS